MSTIRLSAQATRLRGPPPSISTSRSPAPGTRNFFADTLGFPRTGSACTHDIEVAGPNAGTYHVEEHHGQVLADDPNGLAPFSIAQWIAQRNGAAGTIVGRRLPGRSNVAEHVRNGVDHSDQPVQQRADDRVAEHRVPDHARGLQHHPGIAPDGVQSINFIFVGASSKICSNGLKITQYGFGQPPQLRSAARCGDATTDLRAFTSANL